MPTFKFRGFPTSSAVALSVAQGANDASAFVPTWGQTGTGALSIDVYSDRDKATNLSLVAPTGIWFEAHPTGLGVEELTFPSFLKSQTPFEGTTSTYDPSFHEIFYFWKVTRSAVAASTFSHDLNIPDVWNNRNIAYGKKVAFCFDVPGNYTVECFAVGPTGTTAVGTVTFQSGGTYPAIVDPDTAYPGAATVCVNPAGDDDFTWAPDATNNQKFWDYPNDLSALDAAFAAFNADNTSRRLLFKPATFNIERPNATDVSLKPARIIVSAIFGTRDRVYIGSYGGTATLNCGGSGFYDHPYLSNNASVTITNLDVIGNWDQDTETIVPGVSSGYVAGDGFSLRGSTHYTLHKITSRGFEYPYSIENDLDDHVLSGRGIVPRYILSECSSESWRVYGFYANPISNTRGLYTGRTKLALIGFRAAKGPNALVPPSPDNPMRNASAPMRWGYFDDFYAGASDFFLNGPYNPGTRLLNSPIRGRQRFDYTSKSGTLTPGASFTTSAGGSGFVIDDVPADATTGYIVTGRTDGTVAIGNTITVSAGGTATLASGSVLHYDRVGWPTVNLDRVAMEGGPPFGPGGGNASGSDPGKIPCNGVVDKALFVAIPGAGTMTGDFNGGIAPSYTFRNLTFVQPPSTAIQDVIVLGRDENLGRANWAQANAQPIRFHNVTAVILNNSTQNGGLTPRWYRPEALGFFSSVSFENNVLHAPNLTHVTIDAGPFTSGALAGFTPRYAGFRDNFERPALSTYSTWVGDVANGGTFDILYSDIATTTRTGRAGINVPANNAAWQQYWTTDNPTHISHYVLNGGTAYFDNGRMSGNRITGQYLSDRIRFTNNSGITITGAMLLFLDRRGLLPGPDASKATDPNIPLSWLPTPGSPAITKEDLGLLAMDDFLGQTRTVPRTRGAFEAAG